MKQLLLENALESWSVAIKYCKYIKNGFVTLHYQKSFVSALHNAVELLLKQIMIDKNCYDVCTGCFNNSALFQSFQNAKDLNTFFFNLSDSDRSDFKSITFKKLIEQLKNSNNNQIFPLSISGTSISFELEILKRLRNNESHFYISSKNYLSESDFVALHNLMIKIYNLMEDCNLLPYWGNVGSEHKYLEFVELPISSFSYIDSIKQSAIFKDIKNVISGKQLPCFDTSPYSISEFYFEMKDNASEFSFDQVLTIIISLFNFNLIDISDVMYSDEVVLDSGEIIPPQIAYFLNIL